jgi:hypothetical protein
MSITIEISKPIKNLEGDDITTLVFQEPNFGDMIEMEEVGGTELKKMRTLMVRCSPYELSELNKLTPADAAKVLDKIGSFLDSQVPTTKKKVK